MIPKEIEYNFIEKIYKNISPFIIKTPLIKNYQYLDKFFNTNLFFKLEFLQNSGSFKIRGALNNVLNLSEDQKKNGITAVSAGNHAIAASYVANEFSIKNKIYMYESANPYRIKKVKSLNANLFLTDPVNAFKDVKKASAEGYNFIHPFDGPLTIQGTASLGLEICEQLNKIDNIIIAVGGGGLISGVGSIIRQKFPNCNIIGVEPENANGLTQSLNKNKPLDNIKLNSIADSLCSPLHELYSFNICKKIINEMVNVSDKEIKKSMKLIFDEYKLALEPACAIGVAALLGPLFNRFKNQNTLIILCGSNIDMKTWLDLTNNN